MGGWSEDARSVHLRTSWHTMESDTVGLPNEGFAMTVDVQNKRNQLLIVYTPSAFLGGLCLNISFAFRSFTITAVVRYV